ncbi:FYVE zinc finger protein [Xylariaceae sp. FL0255]|nr:FYVE zinc finger protein [Xylariaceae sp. FL0255]
MPRLPDTQPSHYFQHHAQQQRPSAQHDQFPTPPLPQNVSGYQSQQISPLSTSNNVSPTSPDAFNRQRLRGPMYLPAVLRPNDEYTPIRRPKREADHESNSRPVSSANSLISLPGLGAFSRLGGRSPDTSGQSSIDSEWNLDLFPKPTAQPTRQHWKPDPEATICDEPACLRHFNYWTRRHHCRRCGNIFCDSHSMYGIPLDQDANYNPRGSVSRACGHCYSEFQAWRSRTNSQSSSSEGSVIQQQHLKGAQTAPASPIVSMPNGLKPAAPHPAEVAMSVPRDWHWSTF